MTEKEFRKLRSLDLIQILLTQGNEEARLQEELDRQKEHLAGLRERNDNLKIELNDKDALIETLKQELNRSDSEISDLREELKALYTDKRIDLENIGSLTEVAQRVNHIFEMAQREAEEYLAHPERVQAKPLNTGSDEVAINHQLTVIDSESMDDIKVEVAKKEAAAEAARTSETAIFETSDSSLETIADDTSENTDEVISENMTTDRSDKLAETIADETADASVDAIAGETADASTDAIVTCTANDSARITTAEAAEHNPNNIEEVVTAIAEEAVADTVTAEVAEHVEAAALQEPAVNDTADIQNTLQLTKESKHEPQHHKTVPKKTHSNTNWFRKFINGAKREKSGR